MKPEVVDASAAEREAMHQQYCAGGKERQMAPHVVYADPNCPYDDCDCRMQAIDFRLEEHGRRIHDLLVTAWWDDRGFAGRCPACSRWVHFTIREKRPVSEQQAAELPQLPADWYTKAIVI